MRTFIHSLFWACFFIVSMTQCQFCNNCAFKTFSPEANLYFDFGKGSYWVYKNTTNNKLDSLYIVDYEKENGSSKEGCRNAYLRQGFVLRVNGMPNGISINSYLDSESLTWVSYAFASNSINFQEVTNITVADKVYEKALTLANCCLSNNCQKSDTESRCKDTAQASFLLNKMIFAPAIGIVKFETDKHPVYGKTTFELVSYQIVKP